MTLADTPCRRPHRGASASTGYPKPPSPRPPRRDWGETVLVVAGGLVLAFALAVAAGIVGAYTFGHTTPPATPPVDYVRLPPPTEHLPTRWAA
jgi:hypothetical protein